MLERLSGERDGGIEEEGGEKKKKARRRKGEKKKKDKEESRTEVDIEVSWWIADLKTDQLSAFRVNSKTE